jgi:hypothetical protein
VDGEETKNMSEKRTTILDMLGRVLFEAAVETVSAALVLAVQALKETKK